MPQRARLLYALQRTDTQLALKNRRYREVQAKLGESEALRKARAARDAAEKALSHARAELRDCELEVGSTAAKLKANQDRLYSGRVKNPRELTDLQKESEYLKRRKIDLEDSQIEAMMQLDEATRKAAVAQEEHVVVETAWKEEHGDLSQEYDALRHELAQLLAQRKAVAHQIDADDLAEYDSIRRLRNGRAVVSVKNGVCRVCNVEVPKRDMERARDTDDLFYCSGCERILYVPEDA